VLAAAALRCVGGQFNGRLLFRNEDERARARKWGIDDLNKIYTRDELAKGDCIFAATGVTDGSLLDGVKRRKDGTMTTHTVVMRASTGTVRWVKAEHRNRKDPHLLPNPLPGSVLAWLRPGAADLCGERATSMKLLAGNSNLPFGTSDRGSSQVVADPCRCAALRRRRGLRRDPRERARRRRLRAAIDLLHQPTTT
jgi:hypothetical protein